jgi:hypothetical protein
MDDIIADLDDDNDVETFDNEDGIMQRYRSAVQNQLRIEVANLDNPSAENKLLTLLRDNEWWLRPHHAPKVCDLLQLKFHEIAYYRSIFIWLPDIRWGKEVMPPCPNCHGATSIGAHGFQDSHFGRRICGLHTHYFIISRRYICHDCEKVRKTQNEKIERELRFLQEGAAQLGWETSPQNDVSFSFFFSS